ncbi:MAG: hypothetical protein JWM25_941 [Thermoleophilia bacterium]|nr:hypothetical protein [Thermoleophilia bacterium]MCZ4496358.1 hypothetical protein [Thermoleophilia bacterium]
MTNLHVHDRPLPTTIIPMRGEDTTFVTVEYGERRFRFCVIGAQAPFEVSYLHEFGEPDAEPRAWFPIDPQGAAEPTVLQQYLFPQLIELHEAELFRANAGLPAAV